MSREEALRRLKTFILPLAQVGFIYQDALGISRRDRETVAEAIRRAEGVSLGDLDDVTEVEPLTAQEELMEDARDFCVFLRPMRILEHGGAWEAQVEAFRHLLPMAMAERGLEMVYAPGRGWLVLKKARRP